MDKVLYDLMDWAGIEELVYSESSDPHAMLGAHVVKEGLLIQAFIPTADKIKVYFDKDKIGTEMEKADEAGFFACLVKKKKKCHYVFDVTYDNSTHEKIEDPYYYDSLITDEDIKKIAAGNHYEIYDVLGAHIKTLGNVTGTYFAVWAPCAMRVSVVGDFNIWDGRRHQMRLLGDSGIFELFIPGVREGDIYKYEIKTAKGEPMLKSDPYAAFCELRPNNASIVTDNSKYLWNDADWISERSKIQGLSEDTTGVPLNIYEVHLGSWISKSIEFDENGREIYGSEFYNYRDIAEKLADYVKDMGYTHIELMPIMEHPLDESWGYQVTGYYAPTSRFGTPEDFMYFMDYMHKEGIGVILDWVSAHFPRDLFGLACFDGSCLYEHSDPRKGTHPHWGTLIYNYARPQVSNFLIANALYWVKQFHADGIRMDAVASMLYLDYGKNDGEWIPNIYGGHENLDAIEFLRKLNSIFKKKFPDTLLIAEESTAWPKVTSAIKNDGLGFDYKWNMGWMNDFLGYMQCDPKFRSQHYGELTFSMLYQYSENFILVLSHDEVVHGKCSLVNKMPVETFEEKFANLRATYGFMMMHPGKKLLFMGQEFAQMDEWSEKKGLEWGLLDYKIHSQMLEYTRELNKFYREHEALWSLDNEPEGFEWINCHSYQENVLVFMRKSRDESEDIICVCNFSDIEYPKFDIGVPYYGKYVEIFNSDKNKFGGNNTINSRSKTAKLMDVDDREYGITIKIPSTGVQVFECKRSEIPIKAVSKSTKVKKNPVSKVKKSPVTKVKSKNIDIQVKDMEKEVKATQVSTQINSSVPCFDISNTIKNRKQRIIIKKSLKPEPKKSVKELNKIIKPILKKKYR